MQLKYKRLIELGSRCTKSAGWRWTSGMRTLTGARVLDIEEDTGIVWAASHKDKLFELDTTTELPDLSDPATIGCMITLVRESTKIPGASLIMHNGSWIVTSGDPRLSGSGYETEAEAILKALDQA